MQTAVIIQPITMTKGINNCLYDDPLMTRRSVVLLMIKGPLIWRTCFDLIFPRQFTV